MTGVFRYSTYMILGIDEVGRGVWAGPLVVGAVILGGAKIDGLTDSKALTKKRRELLYDEIHKKAAAIGLGWVSANEIDESGLATALRLATRRAVEQVRQAQVSFDEIIIDGTVNFLVNTSLENYVTTIKKADLLIPSVSAASIVAKVARDRFMIEQDQEYPAYKFATHVGYGTALHRAAIELNGVTPLHRLSIAPLAKYRTVNIPVTATVSDSTAKVQTTRKIGNVSEAVAAEELARRGHEILARNWKTKYCEIDIVSKKGETYYFTEVKHRRDNKSGDGLAAITPSKLRQMRYAARFYAHTQKLKDVSLQLYAITTSQDEPCFDHLIVIEE